MKEENSPFQIFGYQIIAVKSCSVLQVPLVGQGRLCLNRSFPELSVLGWRNCSIKVDWVVLQGRGVSIVFCPSLLPAFSAASRFTYFLAPFAPFSLLSDVFLGFGVLQEVLGACPEQCQWGNYMQRLILFLSLRFTNDCFLYMMLIK